MLQEKLRAFIFWSQFPYDDGIKRDLTLTGPALPGIRKLFKGNDL